MTSTLTAAQFRKAAASSPQQACVMIYRDERRTLVWDDKLADTSNPTVPIEQCLVLDHDQFDRIQSALRIGAPLPPWLSIVRQLDGHYEFSAPPRYRQSVGTATLRFDHVEYLTFVEAVCGREFDRSAFAVPAK